MKTFRQHVKETKDQLPLDKPTPSAEKIAKKHGVSVEYIEAQIKVGVGVEKEHTSSETAAREIAMDHLSELPDYYKKLKKYVE